MANILLVEDEAMISEPFSIILRSQNYDVDVAYNGLEALEYCSKKSYNLILLDIMMPYCNGVEFLEKASLKTKSPKTKVVMMTNLSSGGKEIAEAVRLGAQRGVLKANMTPKALIELVKTELAAKD